MRALELAPELVQAPEQEQVQVQELVQELVQEQEQEQELAPVQVQVQVQAQEPGAALTARADSGPAAHAPLVDAQPLANAWPPQTPEPTPDPAQAGATTPHPTTWASGSGRWTSPPTTQGIRPFRARS